MADDGKEKPPLPPQPQKIEYNSPYYLGPQDRPGDYITPVKLRSSNYDEWAGSIRTALRARRKFGFVDGTYTTPTAPCTVDDWWTIQSMLVAWLMNTIDPEVKSTLSNYDDAGLLWEHFKERFSVVNVPRIQQIKANISKCEQSATMSVSTYYGKLNVLWDELSNHESILSCSCGLCTCNLGKLHEKHHEDERLHQFLMGLYSPYYAQVRSTLLSQDPLPSLNRAYQQIIQEERVRGIVQNQDGKQEKIEVLGFAVRTTGRGRGRVDKSDKLSLTCSHCKKSGHEIVNCFELVGYPYWWETRKEPEGKGGAVRGKTKLSTQMAGRGRGVRANIATVDTPAQSVGQPSNSSVPLPGFSAEQWKTLVAAFGNKQPPSDRLTGPTFEGDDWDE